MREKSSLFHDFAYRLDSLRDEFSLSIKICWWQIIIDLFFTRQEILSFFLTTLLWTLATFTSTAEITRDGFRFQCFTNERLAMTDSLAGREILSWLKDRRIHLPSISPPKLFFRSLFNSLPWWTVFTNICFFKRTWLCLIVWSEHAV